MADIKDSIPRSSYKGVVPIRINGLLVLIGPQMPPQTAQTFHDNQHSRKNTGSTLDDPFVNDYKLLDSWKANCEFERCVLPSIFHQGTNLRA